jgi:hypothetical protein
MSAGIMKVTVEPDPKWKSRKSWRKVSTNMHQTPTPEGTRIVGIETY